MNFETDPEKYKQLGNNYSANVPGILASSVSEEGLCSVQKAWRFSTQELTPMAKKTTNIFPHKLSNVVLSNSSPHLAPLSNNSVTGWALEAVERLLSVSALDPYTIHCTKGRGTVEIIYSVYRDIVKKPNADLKQQRQYLGSQKKFSQEHIMNLLSEFSSMSNESLEKMTTVKHHIDLKSDSRSAF